MYRLNLSDATKQVKVLFGLQVSFLIKCSNSLNTCQNLFSLCQVSEKGTG